jgi:hypothetical protein
MIRFICIFSGLFLFVVNCNPVNPTQPATPKSTDIRAFCVSGPNLFAGTYDGGIFRSTDNGESWTAVNHGLTTCSGRPNPCVLSFAVNGNNIFAGTGYDQGLFFSTNNGESWTSVNSGLPFNSRITLESISALIVHGDSIFAGTGCSGIFLSTNNGKSWTDVGSGLTTHITSGLNPEYTFKSGITSFAECGGDLFAGTYDGVFRLTHNDNNGTIKWTSVSSGLESANYNVTSLAVSGNNLFAGTCGGGVFLSSNNGASWKPVNSGLFTDLIITSVFATGNRVFASTQWGVFLSTNNGASWTAVKSCPSIQCVWRFFQSGNTIFAGTQVGDIFRSTDNGESWTAANSGLMDFAP